MASIKGIVVPFSKNKEFLYSGEDALIVCVDIDQEFLIPELKNKPDIKVKLMCNNTGLKMGDYVYAEGDWEIKPYFNNMSYAVRADFARIDIPDNKIAAASWLKYVFAMPLFGITADAVDEFVRIHGDAAVPDIIDDPDILIRISKTPRISQVLIINEINRRVAGWKAHRLLLESRIEEKKINRILTTLNVDAYSVLSQNPYKAVEVPTILFNDADKIGVHMGVPVNDRRRLTGIVKSVLDIQNERGSLIATGGAMIKDVANVSDVDSSHVTDFLRQEIKHKNNDFPYAVGRYGRNLYCASIAFYEAEKDICEIGSRFLQRPEKISTPVATTMVETLCRSTPEFSRFDATQKRAVAMATTQPFCIVTGGPGTGKSTIMDAVVRLTDRASIVLTAPTNKAAKRLSETTGLKTSTLHTLLRARGGVGKKTTWGKNASSRLPSGSVIVVDEVSMVDVEAMAALMRAMPDNGRVILVGDSNQLPSVGPGAVLRDLIASRKVPVTELVNVYRSGADSGIALGAVEIRHGRMPAILGVDKNGVSFIDAIDTAITDKVVALACDQLRSQGFDPITDVAILCPQAPGPAGTWEINKAMSARLNPGGKKIPGVFTSPYDDKRMPVPKSGDRVMLTVSDGDNLVNNGDEGFIRAGGRNDDGAYKIEIEYDCGVKATYPASQWRNFILSYATTVHKSQGSQYPVVIMPQAIAHTNMLDRTLVYTGWTRAQKMEFLIGDRNTFNNAIKRYRGNDRLTLLKYFFDTDFSFLPDRLPPPAAPTIYKEHASVDNSCKTESISDIESAVAASFGARSNQKRRRLGALPTKAEKGLDKVDKSNNERDDIIVFTWMTKRRRERFKFKDAQVENSDNKPGFSP